MNYKVLYRKYRPKTFDEIVGQNNIITLLKDSIINNKISHAYIFSGPRGTGKTSTAKIFAKAINCLDNIDGNPCLNCEICSNFNLNNDIYEIDAASNTGVDQIREIIDNVKLSPITSKYKVYIIDEVHMLSTSAFNALLLTLEEPPSHVVFILATTNIEDVPITVLSRCQRLDFRKIANKDIHEQLKKVSKEENIDISDDCLHLIASFSNGDARNALSTLEMVINNSDEKDGIIHVSKTIIEQCTQKKSLLYDKKGEEHYNLISALHKSMRNSDPDAAIYWLSRMLEAGEDPLYVARRVIRFASEDIGLADPRALSIANDAYTSCHYIGMPECSVILTQAVVYMSMAPKSNSLYVAYETAKKDALKELSEPVPLVIRNAPTKLMKELHYGEGYQYAHDTKEKITNMQCLPDSLKDREYYLPGTQGAEKQYKNRLDEIKKWRKENQ